MSDSISVIPDHIADFARSAFWIELVGMQIESVVTPDDAWFRASTRCGTFSGKWRFGSVVEAVESAVVNAGREWTEQDVFLFAPHP